MKNVFLGIFASLAGLCILSSCGGDLETDAASNLVGEYNYGNERCVTVWHGNFAIKEKGEKEYTSSFVDLEFSLPYTYRWGREGFGSQVNVAGNDTIVSKFDWKLSSGAILVSFEKNARYEDFSLTDYYIEGDSLVGNLGGIHFCLKKY